MNRNKRVFSVLLSGFILLGMVCFQLQERDTSQWSSNALNDQLQVFFSWLDANSEDTVVFPSAELEGRVVDVKDGDTLVVRGKQGEEVIVRLYGIDAPEWNQPFGQSASDRLEELVGRSRVRVIIEDTDTYGRLVGTVYLEEENINLAMVQGGFAWWYEYYANSEHALEQAEEHARTTSLGLWQEANPVRPWDWRRRY